MAASKLSRDGLSSFKQRLDNVGLDRINKAAEDVATKGLEYAQSQFSASKNPTDVTVQKKGYHITIQAKGEQVLYEEFGTGKVGRGTYEGTLPTQTFTFVSPRSSGDVHTTRGWEYFYPNPKTKRGDAWYFKRQRYVGERAAARMWKTREYMRANLKYIVLKAMKGSNND